MLAAVLAVFPIFVVIVLNTGVGEKIFVGWQMANKWSDPPIVIMASLILGIPAYFLLNLAFAYFVGILALPLPTLALVAYYQLVHLNTPPADTTKYVEFKVLRL